jgi:hypothetical protein
LVKPAADKQAIVATEAHRDKEGVYKAKTAWITRESYLKKKKLLFARSEPAAAVPVSGLTSQVESQKLRGETTANAGQKSNLDANLPPQAENVKPEITEDEPPFIPQTGEQKIKPEAQEMSDSAERTLNRAQAVQEAQKLLSSATPEGNAARKIYNDAKREAASRGMTEKEAQQTGFEAVVDFSANKTAAPAAQTTPPAQEFHRKRDSNIDNDIEEEDSANADEPETTHLMKDKGPLGKGVRKLYTSIKTQAIEAGVHEQEAQDAATMAVFNAYIVSREMHIPIEEAGKMTIQAGKKGERDANALHQDGVERQEGVVPVMRTAESVSEAQNIVRKENLIGKPLENKRIKGTSKNDS